MPEGKDIFAVKGGVHQPLPHDSAHLHVSGQARYIDDLPMPANMLSAYIGISDQASAEITQMDLQNVAATKGVVRVLTAGDILGQNDVSPTHSGDDPVFAKGRVDYAGQALFAVVAESRDIARRAVREADIHYRTTPAQISVAQALQVGEDLLPPHVMRKGDALKAVADAPHRLSGRLTIGGQDHFYLEGQIALAVPQEDGDMLVYSSTQHPSEVQQKVAQVLGYAAHRVTVEVRRMGGGFGGKESQPALFAAIAALAAQKTQRPVKLRLDRDDDMIMTGKRHDFLADYQIGFDGQGNICGLVIDLAARCGMSADLSAAICDRAMFHCDNCYYLPHALIRSRRLKTHTVSNTAFRGFGGPQGMLVIEHVIDAVATKLQMDPVEIRQRNLYGPAPRNITPYHMAVDDNIAPELIEALLQSSDYQQRRQAIRAANAKSPILKRGIALTPVKFGISFTTTHLNQAGALIHIYNDGSIHLNHGGTEMGQGLFIKVAQVVAEEFQVDLERVKISATTTAKVPNTSATAASSGSDINGKAAQAGAQILKQRLTEFAAERYGVATEAIVFAANQVHIGNQTLAFDDLIHQAYMARVSLSATGFYRTPKIYYDREQSRGRPFYYFAYGAAVSEVEIDCLTGENRVCRVDILHDVGRSLNSAIDLGQIEGGFIQGQGWLTIEELVWSDDGRLLTHAPSTYKIPVASDRAPIFNMDIWHRGEACEDTIFKSKAVGEPPLMLAISVFSALTDAVASVADYQYFPNLDAPATPERILKAITTLKEQG